MTATVSGATPQHQLYDNSTHAIKINNIKPDFCDEICLPPLAKPKRNGRHQKKRKENGDRPKKTQGLKHVHVVVKSATTRMPESVVEATLRASF